MSSRFTLDGSANLESELASACDSVCSAVREQIPPNTLEAIVLAGGYGRGEGGVCRSADGDRPYNDLEFYVFLRGNRLWNQRRYVRFLGDLSDRLSRDAAVHIELKLDSLRRLRHSPVSMFSYDLVSRHRVVWPSPGSSRAQSFFEGCDRHLNASQIPLSEATRLLFNRCTGLWLARELLRSGELMPGQRDFIGRNIAKLQLALGDVVLTAERAYHWSCLERRDRFQRLKSPHDLPHADDLRRHHMAGVEFKLHPSRVCKSSAEFHLDYQEISRLALRLWLWLENKRLNRSFSTAFEYASSPIPKCGGSPAWRNLALNAITFGPTAAFDFMAFRYPRERLLNALTLLLWGDDAPDAAGLQKCLQQQLRTHSSEGPRLAQAYKALWPRFS